MAMQIFLYLAVSIAIFNICYSNKAEYQPVIWCSPPQCPSGCYIQEVYTGSCPGCECPPENPSEVYCPPLRNCPNNCKIDVDRKGCQVCQCPQKPVCPSIRCVSPCFLQRQSGELCPRCKCPEYQCSPPRCFSPCMLNYNTKPCPSCDCPNSAY